jgi:hypothetical protein
MGFAHAGIGAQSAPLVRKYALVSSTKYFRILRLFCGLKRGRLALVYLRPNGAKYL